MWNIKNASVLGEVLGGLVLEEATIVTGPNGSLKNKLADCGVRKYLKRGWAEVAEF